MPCRSSLDVRARFPCFQTLMPDICFLPRLLKVSGLERVQQHDFDADTDTVRVGVTACSALRGGATSPSSPAMPQLTAPDPLGKILSGWERTEEKEFFFLQFVDDVRRNLGHGSSSPGFPPESLRNSGGAMDFMSLSRWQESCDSSSW